MESRETSIEILTEIVETTKKEAINTTKNKERNYNERQNVEWRRTKGNDRGAR